MEGSIEGAELVANDHGDDEAIHGQVPGGEGVFHRLLLNTLVTGVTSSFVWFALTFWVYLETRSVVATGVIGGAYGLSTAVLAPAFGTYVDQHRKHAAMVLATTTSVVCFVTATVWSPPSSSARSPRPCSCRS